MKKQKTVALLFSILSASFIFSANTLAVPKLVVDANAPLTIEDEIYKDITSAISRIDEGGTIIVRPGMYVGTSNNNISFESKNIRLVSAQGAESTIIDCQNAARRGVVINGGQDRTTLLQGFTIQNCNFYSSNANYLGGGLYIDGSSPTISRNIFKNNRAYGGGGIASINAAPKIDHNLIFDNTAYLSGGGLYLINNNSSQEQTLLENNLIYNNSTNFYVVASTTVTSSGGQGCGGGTYHRYTTNYGVRNSTGGGVCYESDDDTIASNNIIWGNSSQINSQVSPQCNYSYPYTQSNSEDMSRCYDVDCNFFGCWTVTWEEANKYTTTTYTQNWKPTPVTIENSNSIIQGGGVGLNVIDADPQFTDANTNDFRLKNASPAIDAGKQLDGIYSDFRGSLRPMVGNPSINTDNNFDIGPFEYSGKEGITFDPIKQFFKEVKPAAKKTLADKSFKFDLTMADEFPDSDERFGNYFEVNFFLMDANGFKERLLSTEIFTTPTPVEGYSYSFVPTQSDIGTHRLLAELKTGLWDDLLPVGHFAISNPFIVVKEEWELYRKIILVDEDLPVVPGKSYKAIKDAVEAANDGDIVLVKPGPYSGERNLNISFGGKNIRLISERGAEETIIDCNSALDSRAFVFSQGEDENSSVQGFTIQNCYRSDSNDGAAILINGASPTIRGNRFYYNIVGAGSGGAISISNSTSLIHSNLFLINSSSSGSGGAIMVNPNTKTFGSKKLQIISNTFYNNKSSNGDSINYLTGSSLQILSSIFWGNLATSQPQISRLDKSTGSIISETAYIGYNLVKDGLSNYELLNISGEDGGGNIDDNPQFVDVNSLDFRLQSTSPAIDNGKNIIGLFSDYRGSIRPIDGTLFRNTDNNMDMGAYEYSGWIDGNEDVKKDVFNNARLGASVLFEDYQYNLHWTQAHDFSKDIRLGDKLETKIYLIEQQGENRKIPVSSVKIDKAMPKLGYNVRFKVPTEIGYEACDKTQFWKARVEMDIDSVFFSESVPFEICQGQANIINIGDAIVPPPAADGSIKPLITENEGAFVWDPFELELKALSAMTNVLIFWYTSEGDFVPQLVTVSWPQEVFTDIKAGGSVLFIGYDYLINWQKIAAFPGENVAVNGTLTTNLFLIRVERDTNETPTGYEIPILEDYEIPVTPPADGYFARHSFDESFSTKDKDYKWKLRVEWKDNPTKHFTLSDSFEILPPAPKAVFIGEEVTPPGGDNFAIDTTRIPDTSNHPTAFSWNYSTRKLIAKGLTTDTEIYWYSDDGMIISEKVSTHWPKSVIRQLRLPGNSLYSGVEYDVKFRKMSEFPGNDLSVFGEFDVNLHLVPNSASDQDATFDSLVFIGRYTMPTAMPSEGYSVSAIIENDATGDFKLLASLVKPLEAGNQYFTVSDSFSLSEADGATSSIGEQVYPPVGADPNIKPTFLNYAECFYWDDESKTLWAIAPAHGAALEWQDSSQNTIPQVMTTMWQPDFSTYKKHVSGIPQVDLLPTAKSSQFNQVEILYSTSSQSTVDNYGYFSSPVSGYTVLKYTLNGVFQRIEVVRSDTWWDQRGSEIDLDIGTPVATSTDPICEGSFVYNPTAPIATNLRESAPYDGYDWQNRVGPIVAISTDDQVSVDNDLVVVEFGEDSSTGVCWVKNVKWYDPQIPQSTQKYVAGSAPVDLKPDYHLFVELKYNTGDTQLDSNKQFTSSTPGYAVIASAPWDAGASTIADFEVIKIESWLDQVKGKQDIEVNIGTKIANFATVEEPAFAHNSQCGGGHIINSNAPFAVNTRTSYPYSGYDTEKREGPIVPVNVDPSPLSHNDFVVVWFEKTDDTCWPARAVRYNPVWPAFPQKYVAGSTPVAFPQDTYDFAEIKYATPGDAGINGELEFASTLTGKAVIAYGEDSFFSSNIDNANFLVVETIDWENYVGNTPIDIGKTITGEGSGHEASCGGGYLVNELGPYAVNTKIEAPYDGINRETREGPIVAVNKSLVDTDKENDFVVVWYEKKQGICWPALPVRYAPEWADDAEHIIIASGQGSGYLDPQEYMNPKLYFQDDPLASGYNPNEEQALILDQVLFALRDDKNTEETSEPYAILKYQDPADDNSFKFKAFKVVQEEAPYFFKYSAKAGTLIQPPNPLSQFQPCSQTEISVEAGKSWAGWKDHNNNLYAAAGALNEGDTAPEVNALFYARWLDGTCEPWPLDEQGNHRPIVYDIHWPDSDYWNNYPVAMLSRGDLSYLKSSLPATVYSAIEPLKDQVFDSVSSLDSELQTRITDSQTYLDHKNTILDKVEKPLLPSEVPKLKVGETLIHPKYGLPEIDRQCAVEIIADQYQLKNSTPDARAAKLVDVLSTRWISLDALPEINPIKTINEEGKVKFHELPFALRTRLAFDPISGRLEFRGLLDESGSGEPLLLLNVISLKEEQQILDLHTDSNFRSAVSQLAQLTRDWLIGNVTGEDSDGNPVLPNTVKLVGGNKALTAGDARGTGYMTLAMQADQACGALPVSLNVIKVDDDLFTGEIKVIYSNDPFEEIVTLKHNSDFGGELAGKEFEWKYLPSTDGIAPPYDPSGDNSDWIALGDLDQSQEGAMDIEIKGSGLRTLKDYFYIVRYKGYDLDGITPSTTSTWTKPQLYEGWIKRVMRSINPYEQRVKNFHTAEVDTIASMIRQAGQKFEGDIALNANPESINSVGLIETYETVLNRGKKLSIDGTPQIKDQGANDALLLATGRIADLYMLLGNEAYADAADPTIGFGTANGQYGSQSTSIFSFQNQLPELIDEELALLRGRDNKGNNPVQTRPFYNRLIWNFTSGMDGGEVAYNLNYNLKDQNEDGVVDTEDAKTLFPQGHGDAWGHYLTAIKSYYTLLRHSYFEWQPRSESVLVAQVPINVDYLDERKFARAAVARAKTGQEIVHLTYQKDYQENSLEQWKGFADSDPNRAWGVSEWATRAGMGAYLDWITANRLIPANDVNPNHVGVAKVDRTTVTEISEIVGQFSQIQAEMDKADKGLNPLGLAKDAVPFDIDPNLVAQGKTHFEQVYDRAVESVNSSIVLFNYANENSQRLRMQQDALTSFQRNVDDREASFNNQLIEVFGYPYADDIGAGGSYVDSYNGPDIYHYMYVDPSELMGEDPQPVTEFTLKMKDYAVGNSGELTESVRDVKFHLSEHGLGLIKPGSWLGRRRAPGEIQMARGELLQAKARFEKGLIEYNNLLKNIEDQAELLKAQHDLDAEEIKIQSDAMKDQITLNTKIKNQRQMQMAFRLTGRLAQYNSNAISEAIPKIFGVIAGTAAGMISDPGAPARGASLGAGGVINEAMTILADVSSLSEMGYSQSKEEVSLLSSLKIKILNADYIIQQKIKQLEQTLRSEASLRLELLTLQENLQQSQGRYLVSLAKGQRLQDELKRFRQQTASQVQDYRYKDMAFRIFRNDALQKYRSQYDMAARYVYLAAKTYDYETNQLADAGTSGLDFLTDIVKQRTIGQITGGQPVTGAGLADPMKRMMLNFSVLKGQLGFNNPQTETNRFSLRKELFRIKAGSAFDKDWKQIVQGKVVDNLWDIPEFRKYARPFASENSIQPGLVIEFDSNITSGMNFFGWPLGGGDSTYSPTNFATKVRSVGVWFSNYNNLGMVETPRIYLVPVGMDVMRSPSGTGMEVRNYQVLDQKLPVPLPITSPIKTLDWTPADQLNGELAEVRKHSTFRAYHDSGTMRESEMSYDSRLIGRSVWNTKWMLIIPGASLHGDPKKGLDMFINGPKDVVTGQYLGQGVSDIKLFFQTYAYSGN